MSSLFCAVSAEKTSRHSESLLRLQENVHSKILMPLRKALKFPAQKLLISNCDSQFLMLFQVFTSNASSFRQVFLAQPYKARIWSASDFLLTEIVSFQRAMINAAVTVVVRLNSFVQLKIK